MCITDASRLAVGVLTGVAVAVTIVAIALGIALYRQGTEHEETRQQLKRHQALDILEPALMILFYHTRPQGYDLSMYHAWKVAFIKEAERIHGPNVWIEYGSKGILPLVNHDRYPQYACSTQTMKLIETAIRQRCFPAFIPA